MYSISSLPRPASLALATHSSSARQITDALLCYILCYLVGFIYICDAHGLENVSSEMTLNFSKDHFEFGPTLPKFSKFRIYRWVPNFFIPEL